jgi:hypothetical protein
VSSALGIQCDVILVSDASYVSDWLELQGRWSLRKHFLGLKGCYDVASRELYERERSRIRNNGTTGDTPHFVHISIDTIVDGEAGYLPRAEQEQIKNIRTDFDYFSGKLIRALVLHGQYVTHQTMRTTEPFKTHFSKVTWMPWDPHPTREAGGQLHSITADDLEREGKRRRPRLLACEWPTAVNVLSFLAMLFFLWMLWYGTRPTKPSALFVSHISIFKADGGWLDPYQNQSFDEGVADKKTSKITDVQLIRFETNQIPHDTIPFGLHISVPTDAQVEFRVRIFRVHTSEGRPLTESIPSQGGEPPPVEALAIKCSKGDRLLIVGQIRKKTGDLPRNLDDMKKQI